MSHHPNDPKQVSRYKPIWDKLKKDGKVSLLVLPHLKNRVIKAVRKKRDEDLGFKFTLSEAEQKAWIDWEYEGTTLTATLRYTKYLITLDDL